jgi:hypothetical protein
MALTRVQATPKANGGAVSSLAVTFGTQPVVGNGIAVTLLCGQGTPPPASSVTDNRGNTYLLALTQGLPTVQTALAVYYCPKITATGTPFTITAAFGGGRDAVLLAVEVGGLGANSLAVDQTAGAGGTSAAPATGATAALTADEVFLVSALSTNNYAGAYNVESVSPAWTEEVEHVTFSAQSGEVDTRIRTGVVGTTQSCSWVAAGGSVLWGAGLVAFKVSAPVGTSSRVTQDAVELLSLPTPAVRVSQELIEVLGGTVSALTGTPRVTQAAIELLSLPAPAARTTQAVVEVLSGTTSLLSGTPRLTQDVIEVLSRPLQVGVRVTSIGLEFLRRPLVELAVTQLALEVFYPRHIPTRVTQTALEVYRRPLVSLAVTQHLVEVFLRLPPCTTGVFAVDVVTAGGSCPTGILD